MLDATSCSLAGLCFCLLAISAAALTSSTIFCCIFQVLPLLLFGCPLFARFKFPSQAKPVAVKRHRKRGRLKTDTVANDNIGASGQEALATDTTLDAFAFQAERRMTGCNWNSFVAMVVAVSVVGAAAGIALAIMQSGVSNTLSFYSKAECGSNSGGNTGVSGDRGISAAAGRGCRLDAASSPSSTGTMAASPVETLMMELTQTLAALAAVAATRLGPGGSTRNGLNGGHHLMDGSGRLGSEGGARLRCRSCYRLGSACGNSFGWGGCDWLGSAGGDGLGLGIDGHGPGECDQLTSNSGERLDGSQIAGGQLRRDSRNRLGSGDDDPPRDYGSDSDGLGSGDIGGGLGGAWLEATSVAASGRRNRGDKVQKESGPVLARMTFDKDNPTARHSGVPGLLSGAAQRLQPGC